jgi:hypothetical protein
LSDFLDGYYVMVDENFFAVVGPAVVLTSVMNTDPFFDYLDP